MTEQEELPQDPDERASEVPANRNGIPDTTPTGKLNATADGMAAFNSVLWEIAKTFGIITVILLMIFALFMAWQIAQWGMTTL